MATKFCRLILFGHLNPIQHQCRIYVGRSFSLNKVSYNTEKWSLELLPEVENLLESGDVKHRKHPGIRKMDPITLPEVLASAVDKLISDESERLLLKEADSLCKQLSYRRKPAEKEDIDQKIMAMHPLFEGDYEELSYVLTNPQLKELNKRINLEVGRWKPIEYNRHRSLAYLVGRLAPNYASTSHVFGELKKHEPTFQPKTFFDFGSGVGSALWAAHSHWSDSIKEYFCTDISPDMNDLCESLISEDKPSESKHIQPVFFRQFFPASEKVKFDLVVSAFSLLELHNTAERLRTIDILWRKTKDFLVIIEYGTVAGFSCVLDARDYILKVENDSAPEFSAYNSGAYVVSPCPHDFPCPKFIEDSSRTCGFHVPYHPQFPRHRSKVILKDWISYVILKKGRRPDDYQALPRIVEPVLKKAKHIYCRFCCNDGKLKQIVVTKAKHGRNAYRCVRRSKRGDLLHAVIKPAEDDDYSFGEE